VLEYRHPLINEKRVFDRLQILRALAALGVMLFHYTLIGFPAAKHFPVVQGVWTLGMGGVDVFFIISGFIITHTYQTSHLGPGRFLLKRALRIYSGYWIVLSFAVLAHLVFAQSLAGYDLQRAVFLLPQVSEQNPIPVVWTLYHELMFYIAFTALVMLPPSWRKSMTALICAALVALFSIHWQQGYFASERAWLTLSLYATHDMMFYLISPHALEFMAGVALYILRDKYHCSGLLLWFAFAGFIGAGLLNVSLFGGELGAGYYTYQRVILLLIPSVLLVVWAVTKEGNPTAWPECGLVHIGNASYMLYLVHIPILHLAFWLGLHSLENPYLYVLTLAGCAIASIALALVISRYLERPFYHLLCKWLTLASTTMSRNISAPYPAPDTTTLLPGPAHRTATSASPTGQLPQRLL
jgi:peptidoglycan/LPS O-acetylase OafA/YrhL